ncbi:hypothetical protein FBZ84_106114 [Azospirillum baldaniorum]|nr:hypothetical protein FBZ84_106114 [Azospirillum baldaniorum]
MAMIVAVRVPVDLAVRADMLVAVIMVMVIMIVVVMIVTMVVVMAVRVAGFDFRFAFGAAADRAHHSTSSSLTRISSPPVTISWWPPHSGQGANRSGSGTGFSQDRQKA